MKKIFVVLITLFCLVTINVASIVTFAAERQIVEKLLVITNEETSAIFENSEDYENIEFVDIDSVDDSFSNYISYAVAIADSMNANINQILRNAYNDIGSKIYIYGGLTLNDYKEILSINDLYINMNASDSNGAVTNAIKMRFDGEQEDNKKEAIIGLTRNSNSQSLTVTGEGLTQEECINIIIEHFNSTFVPSKNRETVIIYSSYGHRVYSTQLSTAFVNVDYILYREQAEEDPTYDYYALKTNVTGTQTNPDTQIGRVSFTGLEVKHKLVNSSDNVTDYAPKDVNRATNVGVSLNIGTNGLSIGINFTSGAGPTIDSSYDVNTKEVQWKVSRYWLFGRPFSGDMFTFGTSWATRSKASIDVSTHATFSVVNNFSYNIDWDTQRVTFG